MGRTKLALLLLLIPSFCLGATKILPSQIDFSGGVNFGSATFTNINSNSFSSSQAFIGSGANISTISTNGSIFLNPGSSITLSGSGGTITSASSVTASAFFGNVSSTTGLGCVLVPASGTTSNVLCAGGNSNSIVSTATRVSISGGINNYSGGNTSTIGGGSGNQVVSVVGSVSGFSTVGGGSGNIAGGNGATVAGGVTNNALANEAFVGGGNANSANATFSTVGGGSLNVVNSTSSFIGGGRSNTTSSPAIVGVIGGGFANSITASSGTIVGGTNNTVSGIAGAIGGGASNTVSGAFGTISGGANNTVSQTSATVAGGYLNTASGLSSFAAGTRAKATHDGSWVWADAIDPNTNFFSQSTNSFNARATGGFFLFGASVTTTGSLVVGSSITTTSSVTASAFFGDGSHLTGVATGSGAGSSTLAVNWIHDNFTPDGVTKVFNLSQSVSSGTAVALYVDNFHLGYGLDWNFSGTTTLTLTTAPAAYQTVYADYTVNTSTLPGVISSGTAASGDLQGFYPSPLLATTILSSSHTFSGSIESRSSVTASAFFGDGSHLTGVSSTESNTFTSSKTFTTDVLIRGILSGSTSSWVGSMTMIGSTLTFRNLAPGTTAINAVGAVIAASTFNATGTAYQMNGVTVIDSNRNVFASSVTASAFFGDASHLTGTTVGSGGVDFSTITTALATKSSSGTDNTLTRLNALATIGSAYTVLSSMTNTSAGGIKAISSVTAGAYFGDGSHLTGIASGSESNTFTSSKTFTSQVLIGSTVTVSTVASIGNLYITGKDSQAGSGNGGGNVSIHGGIGAENSNSGNVLIQGGNGDVSDNSGGVFILGGNSGTTSQSGPVIISGGDTFSDNAGSATVSGGNATASGGAAGTVGIRGGSSVDGNAGDLNLNAGPTASGTAGVVNLSGGAASAADGGVVNIFGGNSDNSSGNGGVINVTGGAAGGSAHAGGGIFVSGGPISTGGDDGGGLEFSGGTCGGGTNGGHAYFSGGSATNGCSAAGELRVTGGDADSADTNGGSALIRGGDSTGGSGSGTGGDLTIRAGNSISGNGGSITVTPGNFNGTGAGTISIGTMTYTSNPPNNFALCLSGGQIGHCTSIVGINGGCTCVAP